MNENFRDLARHTISFDIDSCAGYFMLDKSRVRLQHLLIIKPALLDVLPYIGNSPLLSVELFVGQEDERVSGSRAAPESYDSPFAITIFSFCSTARGMLSARILQAMLNDTAQSYESKTT